MELYLKLIVVAIVLVVIVMGVFALKYFHDRGANFNVESDPDKYKKIKKDGIYSVYSEQNKEQRKRGKSDDRKKEK